MSNVILNLNDLSKSNEKMNYHTMNDSILSLEVSKSLIDEIKSFSHLDKVELNQRVQEISSKILRSTAFNVDAVDEESDKCVLHILLEVFIRAGYKHTTEFDVIENILFTSHIDYETYFNGELLKLLQTYDIVKYFQWQIINGKDEEFYREFEEASKKMSNNENAINDLLEVTLACGSLKIFKFLMNWIQDHYSGPPFNCPVIVKAASWSIYVKDGRKSGYYECFDHILSRHETDINAVDQSGATALHHACVNKDAYLIKALLEQRANIDIECLKKRIPPELFGNYLDSLVTSEPENLTKSSLTKFGQAQLRQTYADEKILFINLKSFVFCPIQYIELLNLISLNHDYRHLLHHPVLGALQDLTWQLMFWKRVILNTPTMLTRILFLIFLFLPYAANATTIFLTRILVIAVIVGKIYLTIYMYEYYRGTHRVNQKFFHTIILMKIINIAAYIYFVSNIMEKCTISECPRTMSLTFMYFAINITLSIGIFSPSVARYNFMLLKILYNAFKFLLSIGFLILGFALSFVALFGKKFGEIPKNEEQPILSNRNIFGHIESGEVENKTAPAQRFEFYSTAVLKTLFTLSGELDENNFRYNSFFSCVFLASFILVIPIMAVNLLTGLAVGDVYDLKSHSKFWHRKMQCLFTLNSMWQIEAPNKIKPVVKLLDKVLAPFKLQRNLKVILQDNPNIAVNIRTRKIFLLKHLEKYNTDEIGHLNRSSVTDAELIIREREKGQQLRKRSIFAKSASRDLLNEQY